MTVFQKLGTLVRWLFDSEKSIDDFRKMSQWAEDQLIDELVQNPSTEPLALTAHVFYQEFAAEVITALKSIKNISKVYISTPSRSEERRVGKECEWQCSSRWSPYH
jgi:hypothetical protein